MTLRIGPRTIRAVVQEKRQARKTFETARREGRKAGLVEQNRPNLFRTSVANLNPGDEIEVTVEYLEEVEWSRGRWSLAFPLTYTPRFHPAGPASEVDADAAFAGPLDPSMPKARVEIRIDAGLAIEDPVSTSHPLSVRYDGSETVAEIAGGAVVPANRDVHLEWRPRHGSEPVAAAVAEDGPDGRYALVLLVPPADDAGEAAWPTETLFVVDVSGSMAGPSIEQAKAALQAALDRLDPGDTFDLIAFQSESEAFRGAFVSARAEHLEAARRWISGLVAQGGTHIGPALDRAVAQIRHRPDDRIRRIVFLTDGAVGNEDAILHDVVARRGGARLHALGIGNAPNRWFLRKMAELGGGRCEFLHRVDETTNRIDAFFRTIDRPVLADLTLEWRGGEPIETFPATLADLHEGDPLYLSAKLPAGATGQRVVLRGRTARDEWRMEVDLDSLAPEGSGVAVRWARAKVAALQDGLLAGANAESVRSAVVETALAFGLVTRYTSLVAVEEFSSARGPSRTARVPSALPAGSRVLATLPQGGTWEPFRRRIGVVLLAAGVLLGLAAWRWKP